MPGELHEWLSQVLSSLPAKSRSSKWFFSSQILSQLVHDQFGIETFCLLSSAQRILTGIEPALLAIDEETLKAAAEELSRALCEQRFLDLPEEEDI